MKETHNILLKIDDDTYWKWKKLLAYHKVNKYDDLFPIVVDDALEKAEKQKK